VRNNNLVKRKTKWSCKGRQSKPNLKIVRVNWKIIN